MSNQDSKDPKKIRIPRADSNDPFKILGLDDAVDLSNPLVKGTKRKTSAQKGQAPKE